jgi:anti-sigma-K factor RskA
MSEIDIHELGAAYALDALDARERAAFEGHFATCSTCRTAVGEFRETAAALGELTTRQPPAALKSRVLAEVAETRQLSPLGSGGGGVTDSRRRNLLAPVILAAAAAAMLFVAASLVVRNRGDDFGEQVAAMMDDPDAHMVELAGSGPGSLKLVWDERHVAVIGGELPDPGPMRYELWMIDARGAHPMGLLDAADGGEVRRILDMHGDPAAWGVTMERPEGSDAPSEPVLYQVDVIPSS